MFRTSLLPYCSSCREYVASYWTSACHCIHDCRMRQLDALVSVTPYKVLQERAPIKHNVRVHVERTLLSPACRMWSLPIDLTSHKSTHHEDALSCLPGRSRLNSPLLIWRDKIVRPHGGGSESQPNHPMLVQRLHAVAVMLRVVIQAAGCSPEGCVTKLLLDAVTQMSSRLRCAAGWSGSLAYPRRPFSCFVFDRDVVGKPPS